MPPELASIREQYLLADALSLEFQRRTKHARDALYLLVLLAILAFGMYAHVPLLQVAALVFVYLGTIALAYVVWFLFAGHDRDGNGQPWARRVLERIVPQRLHGRSQRKYLDDRALAEASRVQFYWRLAGLEENVEDHYLRSHRSELDWIRLALRVGRLLRADFRIPIEATPQADRDGNLQAVLDHWVEGQRRFFRKNALRDDRRLRQSEHVVHALLLLGAALALAAVALGPRHELWWQGPLLLLAILAPTAAGIVHHRAEMGAPSEQKKR